MAVAQRLMSSIILYKNTAAILPASTRFAAYSTSANDDIVTVTLQHGLPQFRVPLPSRRERCCFTLKPLQHNVMDFINFLEAEDGGVDRVVFLNSDGVRIAGSNSISELLASEVCMIINDQRFTIDTSLIREHCPDNPQEFEKARALVAQLASVMNVDEFYLKRQQELQRRIEEVSLQLEPFEEKRQTLAVDAAQRTRRLTWLGLGAMGLQFGLLARLTWWEYSWDIMEPVTYFVGYGTSMAIYSYYVVTRQEYSFPQVFDRQFLKRFYQLADKTTFDVQHYNELRDELAELKSDLRRLRDPLLHHLPLQQTNFLVKENANELLQSGPPSYAKNFVGDGLH